MPSSSGLSLCMVANSGVWVLRLSRERPLKTLSIVAEKIDAFFKKYRSTPDAGFYFEPPQISGSDDDVRQLRSLIAELENLDESVLSAMAGVAPAGVPGSVVARADLEHSELTKLEHVEPATPHLQGLAGRSGDVRSCRPVRPISDRGPPRAAGRPCRTRDPDRIPRFSGHHGSAPRRGCRAGTRRRPRSADRAPQGGAHR